MRYKERSTSVMKNSTSSQIELALHTFKQWWKIILFQKRFLGWSQRRNMKCKTTQNQWALPVFLRLDCSLFDQCSILLSSKPQSSFYNRQSGLGRYVVYSWFTECYRINKFLNSLWRKTRQHFVASIVTFTPINLYKKAGDVYSGSNIS